MDIKEIIRSRHSVRQYLDKPIPEEIRQPAQCLRGGAES